MSEPEDLLAAFLEESGRQRPSAPVAEKVALCLLDAVALAVAGADHPVTRAVGDLVTASSSGAARWTGPGRASPVDVALVNATAAHAHFADDTDMTAWAHPGSLVCPVPAALASARGVGYDAVLRGVAAGYATLSWLGAEEVVSRAAVDRGFRAGPTLGTVAAAAAGAATLGLDAAGSLSAVGLAADSTGALLAPVAEGSQDWRLQNGSAASLGCRAALLAEAGLRGPRRPLTGGRGLLFALTGTVEAPARWGAPPSVEDIHRVWFKEFPTLGDNMAVAVAAREVHHAVRARGGLDPGNGVEKIVVGMNAHFAAYPGTAFRGPYRTVDQAVASTAFAVATLLRHGRLGWADYPALLDDPELLRLVAAVRIEADPRLSYTEGWVRVEHDGEEITRSADHAPPTVFFRDRAAASSAVARVLGEGTRPAVDDYFLRVDGDGCSSDFGHDPDVVEALATALHTRPPATASPAEPEG